MIRRLVGPILTAGLLALLSCSSTSDDTPGGDGRDAGAGKRGNVTDSGGLADHSDASKPDAGTLLSDAAPIPVGEWIERPMPSTTAISSYMQRGGKHGRAFYHPGLGRMIFGGGDKSTTQPEFEGYGDGTGSEIWSLDVAADTWTLLRPLCVPGEAQPGRPDTVGWAYDSKRDRGLMNPGFYFITQGGGNDCGEVAGWGGYAFSFATKQFSGPDDSVGLPPPPDGWGGDTGASFSVYDPVNDELIRVRNGPTLERLNLEKKQWSVQGLSNGDPSWNPVPNRAELVIDAKGRAVYWVDAWSTPPSLIQVKLTDESVVAIPLPVQYTPPEATDHEVYLAFDPAHRVVFVPNNHDMGTSPIRGLGVFHIDSGSWLWEDVPANVAGSVWGFDEATGALIGIGKRFEPYAYFLYRLQ